MRKVYIVDHDEPGTDEDVSAATDAGASEIICGIPPALAQLGISTFGYHEIADPDAPTPPDKHAELIAAGFSTAQATAILAIVG